MQFSGSSEASSGSAFCHLIAVILFELLGRESQTTDAPNPTEVMGNLGLKTISVQALHLPSVSDSATRQQTDIRFVPLIDLYKKIFPFMCPYFILNINLSYKL